MVKLQPDGTAIIAGDNAMITINSDGTNGPIPATCDLNLQLGDPGYLANCKPLNVWDNHYAVHLAKYKEIPDFLWEVVIKYGIGTPDQLGVYPN
jgi:hypothetical protein